MECQTDVINEATVYQYAEETTFKRHMLVIHSLDDLHTQAEQVHRHSDLLLSIPISTLTVPVLCWFIRCVTTPCRPVLEFFSSSSSEEHYLIILVLCVCVCVYMQC